MCIPVPRSRIADLAGITLSLGCLVHCLLLPLLLLLAPALAPWLGLPESFHAAVLLLALPAAWVAMAGGWRHHRRRLPAILAAAGLLLLALGLAAHGQWIALGDPETADRLLTSLGALSLASAHGLNWRFRHRQG